MKIEMTTNEKRDAYGLGALTGISTAGLMITGFLLGTIGTVWCFALSMLFFFLISQSVILTCAITKHYTLKRLIR